LVKRSPNDAELFPSVTIPDGKCGEEFKRVNKENKGHIRKATGRTEESEIRKRQHGNEHKKPARDSSRNFIIGLKVKGARHRNPS
jgi:hypothetical protein